MADCRSAYGGSNPSPPFKYKFKSLNCVVLQGKGKVHEPIKGRLRIYIPSDVHKDSAFPFKPKEDVTIRIEGKRLIIEKIGD